MLGQHTGAAVIGSTMFPILHRLVAGAKRLPVTVPCVAACTAARLVRAALPLVLAALILTVLAATLVLAVLILAALVLAVLAAALVLAALAALTPLAAAEVILGALLALLDLVAEAATCVLVSEIPGALEALVDLIGMLAGELLRLVLKLGEVWHGLPPVPESCGCHHS
jgi:hypothetical protein